MLKRRDTVRLKQQLADSLGEQGHSYWQVLRLFLGGAASKHELDQVASAVFTSPDQTSLHNSLLASILYNARPTVASPAGPRDQAFVARPSRTLHQRPKPKDVVTKRQMAAIIHTLAPLDKRRLLQMADQPHMSPSQPQLSHPEDRFPNSLPSSTLSNAAIDAVPLSCVQDRDLPLPQDLRLRMRFLAAMEGMHGIISDEMVQLLQLGVESYVRDLMAIAAGRTRFKPQEQQPEPVVVAPPPKRKPGRRKKSERVAEPTRIVPAPRPPSRLTLGDLDFALGLGSINDQPLLDIIKATLTTD